MKNTAKLSSCFALIMLITGAIDSIRNLPTTALFGASLLFYCVVAAVLFLVPIAVVTAQLSRDFPEAGGVYQWTKLAFGEHAAVFSIWLQWINTLVWYPTILSFIAATFAYLINPNLANSNTYLVLMIISVFWFMSFINLYGVKMSGKIASFCAIAGVFFPLICIVAFAIYWLATGHPNQIAKHSTWLPHSFKLDNIVALTAIITSFLGVELATVHHGEIKHSETMFPRALTISVILIVTTMILGSLAIAFVIPNNHISLISGVMQAFAQFFTSIHAFWMTYVMSILIVIGSLGGLVNWLISPTKGVLQAARDGFLPKVFTLENKYNVPLFIMVIQAVIVTLLALIYLFIPGHNKVYWLLTDLSTELYVFMYILLLAAAMVINYKNLRRPSTFFWGSVGITGCIIALIVGFLTPAEIQYQLNYQLLFGISLIAMIFPATVLIGFKAYKNRQDNKNKI
jgi:amino acid transporter